MIDLADIKNKILSNEFTLLPDLTLENIKYCLEDVIKNKVDGDFLEAGVWKGGACIYAYNIIKHHKSKKKVYVADWFEGLPPPNANKYPVDAGDIHHTLSYLAISQEQVLSNFKTICGDIDQSVVFVKGFFKDSLPQAPVKKLSVLRLDGDMYESTVDTLNNLYNKLSVGGYCIIDDFGHVGAKTAVMDYRNKNNITDEINIIDKTPGAYPSAYWKKTSNTQCEPI